LAIFLVENAALVGHGGGRLKHELFEVQRATIDDWRRKQDDLPVRPEAIRRIIEIGLKVRK